MKQIFSKFRILVFGFALLFTVSCEDFIATDTNRLMLADDNLINSANDSVYSVIGILQKVQQLSDKYVLTGELRADLMDVTAKSESDLRELNSHNISPNNAYVDTRDFYAVINNCNYFIQRVDTNITVRGNKPFVKELLAVRTMRAWTYLQLVLNYGKANYFTKPILTVNDSKIQYPEYEIAEMVDTLIADLEKLNPLTNYTLPNYGSINNVSSRYLFVNTRVLLGDLYLWKAAFSHNTTDYEKAAAYYAHFFKTNKAFLDTKKVEWVSEAFLNKTNNWSSIFDNTTANPELLTLIKMSASSFDGTTGRLNKLCSDYQLTASSAIEQLSNFQTYCFRNASNVIKYYDGDLRLEASLDTRKSDQKLIRKFENNNIFIYRTALVYLRYAEAVNRIGKPGLAFAVLKYGLNSLNMQANANKIPKHELADNQPYVTVFTDQAFDVNTGIHDRGSGQTAYNINYVIPDYTRYSPEPDSLGNIVITKDPVELMAARMDSIKFVENAIVDELALEMAFEGNRFTDLMRFSLHRSEPEFLAHRVASKHSNYNYFYNLLRDRNKWFLPLKTY